jgi:acid phosphatase (class A)
MTDAEITSCGRRHALALATAHAQNSPLPEASKTLISLKLEDVRPAELLPPPADPGTPAHTAEVAELVAIRAAASPGRKAQAVWDNRHEEPALFAGLLGPDFDLSKMPATARYLSIVQDDVHFNRKRP